MLALLVSGVILLRVTGDLPFPRFVLFKAICSSPQQHTQVLTGSLGKIAGTDVHANTTFWVTLNLINEDAETVRIILGMTLSARGKSRLTHRFVADFESPLAQVSYEGLGSHSRGHPNAYREKRSIPES